MKSKNSSLSEQFQNLMAKSQTQARSEPLTHIYMTADSPDLVWWRPEIVPEEGGVTSECLFYLVIKWKTIHHCLKSSKIDAPSTHIQDVIGDEYHYLFICNNTEIQSLRSKYIPKYYVQNSSVAKMAGIFSLCNSQLLKSVALFLKGISKLF